MHHVTYLSATRWFSSGMRSWWGLVRSDSASRTARVRYVQTAAACCRRIDRLLRLPDKSGRERDEKRRHRPHIPAFDCEPGLRFLSALLELLCFQIEHSLLALMLVQHRPLRGPPLLRSTLAFHPAIVGPLFD